MHDGSVLDKTGTLTTNAMCVQKMLVDRRSKEVIAVGMVAVVNVGSNFIKRVRCGRKPYARTD